MSTDNWMLLLAIVLRNIQLPRVGTYIFIPTTCLYNISRIDIVNTNLQDV